MFSVLTISKSGLDLSDKSLVAFPQNFRQTQKSKFFRKTIFQLDVNFLAETFEKIFFIDSLLAAGCIEDSLSLSLIIHLNQCDQIRRKFATLAKVSKTLANLFLIKNAEHTLVN